MNFSHSGDIGDLIAALATIRLYEGCSTLCLFPADCTGRRMTIDRANSLIPLIETQPYIEKVYWDDQPSGLNLDDWRQKQFGGILNLADKVADAFNMPRSKREEPWLFVPEVKRVARVIFNRSSRYRNWNFPWKKIWEVYHKEAVFVGLPEEHQEFCTFVGPVSYWCTPDHLQLAQVIAGCELFIGNQSSCFWLAEALKMPVLQEVFTLHKDCHFERVGTIYGENEHVEIPPLQELAERLINSVIPRTGPTLVAPDRLKTIGKLLRETEQLCGAVAEFGVYKGGSAKFIADLAGGRHLHLFDTFQGVPFNDIPGGAHGIGEFYASLEEVQMNLEGRNIYFHPGLFSQTIESLPKDMYFSFVHVDCDLYVSVKEAIEYFYPRLVPGGIMVFDDYNWAPCPGVNKAVGEFFTPEEIIVPGLQQAFIKKSLAFV